MLSNLSFRLSPINNLPISLFPSHCKSSRNRIQLPTTTNMPHLPCFISCRYCNPITLDLSSLATELYSDSPTGGCNASSAHCIRELITHHHHPQYSCTYHSRTASCFHHPKGMPSSSSSGTSTAGVQKQEASALDAPSAHSIGPRCWRRRGSGRG